MAGLLVRNAKIADGECVYDADISISGGIIESITRSGGTGDKVIDADGKIVIPGVIDPHAHLGKIFGLGSELRTETTSAVTGGVTTLMNLLRENLIGGPYLQKLAEAEKLVSDNAYCDVAFHLGVQSPDQVRELPRYFAELGVSSFKLRMAWLGEQRKRKGPEPVNDGLMLEAMKKIGGLGEPAVVMVHCENPDIIAAAEEAVEREGRRDLAAYTDARPEIAELQAMASAMRLADLAKCPFYIPHVSIGTGVELIRDSRESGAKVIGETCPQYLTHTKNCPRGGLASVDPPLRTANDVAALWDAINAGLISTIGSDHSPHQKVLKQDPFGPFKGFPGVATLLPVLLSEGVNKKRISMNTLVRIVSSNSAKAFGMYPMKGSLRVGAHADLTIVDLHKKVTVSPEMLNSASDFTLFDGWKMEGWPVTTIVSGEIIMDEGQIVGRAGTGKPIRRGRGMLVSPKAG